MSDTNPAKKLSLDEFVREKRRAEWRATCPLCKLPSELRKMLAEGRRKKHTRLDQIEFLAKVHGVKIEATDFDRHHSGRHDIP